MRQEFRLPDLGEGIHEAEIVDVCVAAGDSVREDDIILLVETDKATVEVPSPCTGVVAKIHSALGFLEGRWSWVSISTFWLIQTSLPIVTPPLQSISTS